MFPPCKKSTDGKHNFNPQTGDCMWGCGLNQRGKVNPKNHLSALEKGLQRVLQPKAPKRGIHTELQDLVAQLIEQFNEPIEITVRGKKVKTFGYYIGRLSKVPIQLIYQWRSEIKQSPDIRNEGKVFWWKYKEWMKDRKKAVDNNVVEPPKPHNSGESQSTPI